MNHAGAPAGTVTASSRNEPETATVITKAARISSLRRPMRCPSTAMPRMAAIVTTDETISTVVVSCGLTSSTCTTSSVGRNDTDICAVNQ